MKKRGRPRNEAQYQNTQRMLYANNMFNQTGNIQYLFDAYGDFRHAIKSMIVKRYKGGSVYWGPYQWEYIDSIADELTVSWFENFKQRREKGNPLYMKSPISIAYFWVLSHYPTDDHVWLTSHQLFEDSDNYLSHNKDEELEYDHEDC